MDITGESKHTLHDVIKSFDKEVINVSGEDYTLEYFGEDNKLMPGTVGINVVKDGTVVAYRYWLMPAKKNLNYLGDGKEVEDVVLEICGLLEYEVRKQIKDPTSLKGVINTYFNTEG